jgi:hypothetical protein
MPLFGRTKKWYCPACNLRTVGVDGNVWVCEACAANGFLVDGYPLDVGIRGMPSSGQWERYAPAVPLAVQLGRVVPELALVARSHELCERFDDASFRFVYAFDSGSWDLTDQDLVAAEAVFTRNQLKDPQARSDDARFYVLTACSTSGWQWRVAEEGENGPAPSAPNAAEWLERYRAGGQAASRSELIGLTARAISDEGVPEERSPGGGEAGRAFLSGGYALVYGMLVEPSGDLARIHPPELLSESFRFGVALRDAHVAHDRIAG